MIGHITILSILGSTMLVNAAPQIQGLPSFARQEPNCNNSSSFPPYNPNQLDAQQLNLFYRRWSLSPTCDPNSMEPCAHACLVDELATCDKNQWMATNCPTSSCYAYPTDGNVTKVGCISNVLEQFEKYNYINGPYGLTYPPVLNSPPPSSSMPTSTTKVFPPSMSSPASLPSLTSPGGLGRRYSPSVSPTLSYPDSGMDSTSTSTGELCDSTDGSEMELPTMSCPPMSSHFSSSSTGLHTSMSSDHCAGRPTSLPSSSTSTMLSSRKSPPTPSPISPMHVDNSGLPLPTSSDN